MQQNCLIVILVNNNDKIEYIAERFHMGLIACLIKLQWAYIVDHLTYEQNVSAEKICRFLLATTNVTFITLIVLHDLSWSIPLVTINAIELFSSFSHKSAFMSIAKKLGFSSEEEIVTIYKNQMEILRQAQSAKEVIHQNEFYSSNENTNEYCFLIEESSIYKL